MNIKSFAVRSSGRDFRVVRRPAPPAPVAKPAELKKAELVELAGTRGVDATGTKADILERLAAPESNDATVRPGE